MTGFHNQHELIKTRSISITLFFFNLPDDVSDSSGVTVRNYPLILAERCQVYRKVLTSPAHVRSVTLLAQMREHCKRTRSIPFLLMPWLLASPGHQRQWYWLYRINGVLSSFIKAMYLRHLDAEIWEKRERERLSLSAFLGTEDIAVHIDHISRLIITYTLE